MDISELEQLVDMVRASNIGELTLKHEGERVTIRKSAYAAAPSVALVRTDEEYSYDSHYEGVVEDEDDESATVHQNSVLVTAPLVGVFNHIKPFVGLNARVTEGQVMGIIEAMKIITEIRAAVAGVVIDVFIEDGHPVEFGQALFEIHAD